MVERGVRLKSACKTLRLSRSGLYKGAAREIKTSSLNEVLVGRLKELRLAHPFWGYRRMTAWLRHREGFQVNRKRVYGLMREKGLVVEQARRRALRSPQRAKPKAPRPSQYWGIDMTKFLLGSFGWCYLIIVLDWYTREIVGWNLSLRARTSEWKKALERALGEKFPWGVRGHFGQQLPAYLSYLYEGYS